MVKKRLEHTGDLSAAICSSLHLHGFMAFIIGGADAEHRQCQQCDDEADIYQEIIANGKSEESKLSQGMASLLGCGDAVLVRGLRQTNGKAFGDLEATVAKPISLRDPSFLLVNIRYPDGSIQERSVPVEAVQLRDGSRRRRTQSSSPSEEVFATAKEGTSESEEETTVAADDTSGVPPVDEIMHAKVATLRLWSTSCGGNLDSGLRKPLLILNLCAFWHPQELTTVIERMRNLDKFEEEVTNLSKGNLYLTSPVRSRRTEQRTKEGTKEDTKEAKRKEQIDKLRRIHTNLKCCNGDLCGTYVEEQQAAVKHLTSMELSAADGDGDLEGAQSSASLAQLPITPAERDEILYSMLLAQRRGATPVQRLTNTLFAVLRMEATDAGNSYSTPLGYSFVTVKVGVGEQAGQLTYNCNCSQYRNVSPIPSRTLYVSTPAESSVNGLPHLPPCSTFCADLCWTGGQKSTHRNSVLFVR